MRTIVTRLLTAIVMLMGLTNPIAAQNPYSAAWRVNQSIISNFDIDQRFRLIRALGASGPDIRQTAIDDLIDDRLRADLARGYGIEVDQASIDRAIDGFATQRNMSTAQLRGQMRGAGVSDEALEDFIAASLMWRTILNARFGNRAEPSDDDLNAQVSSIALSSQRSIQLAELVLPYLGRGQDETVALARQLVAELNNGGDWAAAVAEYSRAATAARGGVIGWLDPNRIPEQIAAALRGVGVGQVSQPIFVPSGIILVKILDARAVTSQVVVPIAVNVTYAEITLPPLADTNRARNRAADQFRRKLSGCRRLDSLAAAAGGTLATTGPVDLNALPSDVGLALSRLDPRDSVALLEADRTRILVLCERTSGLSGDSREAMRAQLRARTIARLGDGLMLELRRTALIERQ